MTRIFTTLAALNVVALVAAFLTGVVSQLQHGAPPDESAYVVHFVVGLVAVLGNLLLHCLVMTYFLGTGRLIKEVTLAYELPDERWARPTRDLKRSNTPQAILAMLLAIAVAAAGEGDRHNVWPWWIHLVLACVALTWNFWVFLAEYRNIATNGRILDEVIQEVERIRAERGLPSSAEVIQDGTVGHP
jgi:hypothetical protein